MNSRRSRSLLSPAQAASFSMARALLLFDSWRTVDESPLEIDRAVLIDFVTQNPRLFLSLLSDLNPVLKAYDLQEAGIADLFASRRFESARERFQVVVSELVARDLLHEDSSATGSDSAAFRITEAGGLVAGRFTSSLSQAIRSVAAVAANHWRRRSYRELVGLIRRSLPDQSSEASRLTRPFAEWLLDVEQ